MKTRLGEGEGRGESDVSIWRNVTGCWTPLQAGKGQDRNPSQSLRGEQDPAVCPPDCESTPLPFVEVDYEHLLGGLYV